MKGAMCGFLMAPFILLGALILVGWNEKRAVCEAKAILAGEAAVEEVGCTSAYEMSGELVLLSCELQTSGLRPLNPPDGRDFAGVNFRGLGLRVTSEMYQCLETERSETRSNTAGGGKTTIKTYSYRRDWSSTQATFRATSAARESSNWAVACDRTENPSWPLEVPKGSTEYAQSAAVGPYTVGSTLIRNVALNSPVEPERAPPPSIWQKVGAGVYESNRWRRSTSGIGDVRVRLYGNDWNKPTYTVLGENLDGTIGKWEAPASWLCSGETLATMEAGSVTSSDIFSKMKSANSFLTWVLRFIGFLILWLGFSCFCRPLEVLVDCIPFCGPFLGDIVEAVACCVACLPATACFLVVAGIVWVVMRPVVGGICLAIVITIVIGFIAFRMTRSRRASSEVVPLKVEQDDQPQVQTPAVIGQPVSEPVKVQPEDQPEAPQPAGVPANIPEFIKTTSPNGDTWFTVLKYAGEPQVNDQGVLTGPWFDCMKAAVDLEKNTEWGNDPRWAADGPCGCVINYLCQAYPDKGQAGNATENELRQ